jgi:hypothetical protein
MFEMFLKLSAGALLIAAVAALCACHSDDAAPPMPPVSHAAPLPLLSSPPETSSMVGTVPVSRSDEKVITPAETVGAASN